MKRRRRKRVSLGLSPREHIAKVRFRLSGLVDLAERAGESAEAGHCNLALTQYTNAHVDKAKAVAHFGSTGKVRGFAGTFLPITRALEKAKGKLERFCLRSPVDKKKIRRMERRQPGDWE